MQVRDLHLTILGRASAMLVTSIAEETTLGLDLHEALVRLPQRDLLSNLPMGHQIYVCQVVFPWRAVWVNQLLQGPGKLRSHGRQNGQVLRAGW